MSAFFEELDYRPTPIGALSLRRRREMSLNKDVIEIKLGEEFLMSSLFTDSEIALANLGLAEFGDRSLDVVVGGLGLGYTARTVLEHKNVNSLIVVDALKEVIEWHESGLLPLGEGLTNDPRCCFRHGDFFALAASEDGFSSDEPGKKFDAVLVDIDHSPEFFLDAQNASFYQTVGLKKLTRHLRPGGVFGLWSNDRPNERFTKRLEDVFDKAWAELVTFHNPLQNREAVQCVYLARVVS